MQAVGRIEIIMEEFPDCLDVEQTVLTRELIAALEAMGAPQAKPTQTTPPTPTPTPAAAPKTPTGDLVLIDWGSQSGGGTVNGTSCTNLGFQFRNASDTPINTVTVTFHTSWLWYQDRDEADDGVARTHSADGTPITASRTLGIAPYEESTFRWEICTPEQYSTLWPGWRGDPFGFSVRPAGFRWEWNVN